MMYSSQVWNQKRVFVSCYRSSQVFSGVVALLVCLETSCDTQTVLNFQIFNICTDGFAYYHGQVEVCADGLLKVRFLISIKNH